MGDFEEVERLQAGIRAWLLRTARSGRHELRGISAPAALPMLCAAAFGPALADADGRLLPYDQAHAAVFCGRERLTAELAGLLAGTGIVMVTGACAIADQSLSRDQWASYAGTQPFQRVCPAS